MPWKVTTALLVATLVLLMAKGAIFEEILHLPLLPICFPSLATRNHQPPPCRQPQKSVAEGGRGVRGPCKTDIQKFAKEIMLRDHLIGPLYSCT